MEMNEENNGKTKESKNEIKKKTILMMKHE